MSLAKVIKSIPGVRWLARQFVNEQNNSGDWLYAQPVVEWLYRPELRRQMPLGHRLFARFCQWQRSFSSHHIIGGQTLLRTIIAGQRLCGGQDSVGLELGPVKIFLNLRDPRILQVPNELLNPGPEVQLVKQFLGANDTFLDVGANHGSFSIIAAQCLGAGGRIIAIEPQPRMAKLVAQSLQANAKCRFEVNAFACGDRTGVVEFYLPKASSGTAGLFPGFSAAGAHDKLTVPLKRFDDAFNWREFPGDVFLKLDIEGSEIFFLRGAAQMLHARQPKILLEINPRSSAAAGVSVAQTMQFLREVGYRRYVELSLPLAPQPLAHVEIQRQRNLIVLP